MSKRWTEGDVEDRLEHAASTIHRLPDREGRYQRYKSNWPDYVQHYFAGGVDLKSKAKARTTPTADDISKMDESLKWLNWLSHSRHRDTIALAKIVMHRAEGCSWRECSFRLLKPSAIMMKQQRTGVKPKAASHQTCKTWHRYGIIHIMKQLNRLGVLKRN